MATPPPITPPPPFIPLPLGPAYASDLQPLPGSNVMLDYGTNDTIDYGRIINSITVSVHGGNDTVFTGYGNDTIYDAPAGAPYTLAGGTPPGFKSSGDDVFHAGSGNDTIFAGDGHNTYDGGENTDTVDYSPATVGVRVNLETGTGQGNGTDTLISIENVVGSDQRDNITGSSDDNVLKGGKGDDQLFGGEGRDTLYGGDNGDVLAGGKGADTMYGGDGIDTLFYFDSSAGVTVDLSRGVGHGGDAEGDTFSEVENIFGSQFGDTLIGNNGDNVLTGSGGRDILIGGGGKDTFAFRGNASANDSTVANPDVIKDFVQGEDVIDLRGLNAHWGPVQHQLVDEFSGAANEVMVVVGSDSTTVYADLNGDKAADFAIELSNPVHLTANDLLL
jgi:Ca2+-binding RTX toxin-like protein